MELLGYEDSRTLSQKRKIILMNAKPLFIECGIEGTSMQMIAEKSSITRRSLYNYYESKDLIAIDLQILNLDEISFFENWEMTGSISEIFKKNLHKAMGSQRSQYLFLNRFDSYFCQGYPNRKYIDYLNSQSKENSLSDSAAYWALGNLTIAFLLRLVRRSTFENLSSDEIERESQLFSSLFHKPQTVH